ncbi:hypothetical protein OESDEN_12438 [Oesophagostomum dentatum]|uniref:Uncharacterized protein n=1 Tax=Oesophagostomum dentatum TaxID=61180 RepID=A0A0B1SS47_OESDE|nr:hypothetical protein OESDEN_12438 [Oesophagostomum dentatum]
MDFEIPKPEDFELDFSLENGGCLITVRKYRDFNDETAQKLFPHSSASYVASDSYTIPANYFSEAFWKNEKERLQRIQGVWTANKKKLISYARGEASKDSRFLSCVDKVTTFLNMCDWMLSMCWGGDRSKPPMPLHLYNARTNELKKACALTARRLKELSKDKNFIRKCRKASRNSLPPEDSPSKSGSDDKPEESLSWSFAPIERIGEILSILDAAANAGENVGRALSLLTEIREISKSGSRVSKEEAFAKMEKLNEMVDALEKAISKRKDDAAHEPKAESSKSSVTKSQAENAKADERSAETPSAPTSRKRGRPRSMKNCEDEEYVEKKKSTPVSVEATAVDEDPSDDLVSRVKRGQRNRRPARSFTPGWELSSPSPPPPKVRAAPKATPAPSPPAEPKPSSVPVPTNAATEPTSPDSGRPSSNESSDTAAASKVIEKPVESCVQIEDHASIDQSPAATVPTESLPATPVQAVHSVPSTSLYPAVTPIHTTPSTVDYATPSTSMSAAPRVVLNPPPMPKLDEQTMMAVLKERVQLGDVRLTLMNLMSKDGLPKYHFVPTIIEVVDKAIAALDNKDMIVYSIHKAAVEAGCSQLGTIMRASNPVGMNTPSTAPANSGYVGDLQRVSDIGASPYSYASAPADPQLYPSYVERDISSYLL